MTRTAVHRRVTTIRQRYELGLEVDPSDVRVLLDLVECGLTELGRAAVEDAPASPNPAPAALALATHGRAEPSAASPSSDSEGEEPATPGGDAHRT